MKILRRILIALAVTLTIGFIAIYWIAPVTLSFYSSKKAVPVTRILPTDLTDTSISKAAGTKLSIGGYDFEVPWTDLDDSKTELFPKNKPEKTMARFRFRSGLDLAVFSAPPHSFYDQFTKEVKMSPEAFAAAFGSRASTSDYEFVKQVFEFSPDTIPHWTTTSAVQSRVMVLLLTKSIVPIKSAQTGIFNLRNARYEGFQQGNPHDSKTSKDGLLLSLYSDDGDIEILIAEKDYTTLGGVTQSEINRIVQTLHRTDPKIAVISKD